ncbi:hypothetical protein MHBO_002431 [Bonamia ostreae]|uniref:Uncharacterized protein n=1 Tax=Bonamia ostreae TaxID=126728 RepID=A0ABV2AMB0_9EUKA
MVNSFEFIDPQIWKEYSEKIAKLEEKYQIEDAQIDEKDFSTMADESISKMEKALRNDLYFYYKTELNEKIFSENKNFVEDFYEKRKRSNKL